VGDERIMEVAEGNGPVHALDAACAKPSAPVIPNWPGIHLTDYKVRVLDSSTGSAAVTRVLIDSTDGERSWTTTGVSENVIEASWEALSDSIVLGCCTPAPPSTRPATALVEATGSSEGDHPAPKVRRIRLGPMAQPEYVPLVSTDRVRPSSRLSTPRHCPMTGRPRLLLPSARGRQAGFYRLRPGFG